MPGPAGSRGDGVQFGAELSADVPAGNDFRQPQEQLPLNEPRGGEAQQCAFRAFRGGGLRAGGRCRDGFCCILRRACRDLAASDARLARGDPQGDD